MVFVTMGPIKPLITFAERTAGLDHSLRRRIAIKAVTLALIVGLIFIAFGRIFMELFKFSPVALSLAGGLILLVHSIKSILKEPKGEYKGYATDREVEHMAVYPLAVPLMASPMGLVVLTVISANRGTTWEDLLTLSIMLLIVMAINLVVLVGSDRVTKYLPVEALAVADRILALLLAALAMETIIGGLGQVLREFLTGQPQSN